MGWKSSNLSIYYSREKNIAEVQICGSGHIIGQEGASFFPIGCICPTNHLRRKEMCVGG